MIKIFQYGEIPEEQIFTRNRAKSGVEETVSAILAEVKERGDAALREYARRFDGADPESLEVSREEIDEAAASLDPDFLKVLEKAAENIRAFHSRQKRNGFVLADDGVVTGQKISPIEKVGLCVPGGAAPLCSTVLMDAIPAKIAGCGLLVMVTPPGQEGKIAPSVLAAAKLAGVDRIFKIGGAQAVAALAYGTESVPKVDKIVGPGGSYVAEAKKQVFGLVSIDMIAGPSEILVVADGRSDPAEVASDMLSQCEHDVSASAVLVTDSGALARSVAEEIERQLPLLPREEIARTAVETGSKIIVCDSLSAAVDIANAIAPEHLELCVDDPFSWLGRVKNAGSVFLGRSCPEAVGDYYAGPNHTLPTGGTARFSSPLSVDDFMKKTQFIYYSPEALSGAAEDIARFAREEHLEAHARSVLSRQNAGI